MDTRRVKRDLSGCLLRLLAPIGKAADDLRLAMAANIAVAGESRHDMIVPKVLRPSLVFLRCSANSAPEKRQGLPETVRVEVRKSGRRERLLEYLPDRTGIAPVPAIQSGGHEAKIGTRSDARRREQRIVEPP